jgi:Uma2 family endonuclease
MVMPESTRPWTREMVLALPNDGNRYELFGGELLVTPSPVPRHQLLVSLFWNSLAPYVRAHGLGQVLTSPADLSLGGEQLAQPDLFVVPHTGPAPPRWEDLPNPILVGEVRSASTARYDRQVKRRWFQQARIAEFWIVDPDARVIERWRPDDARPEVLDQSLAWQPQPGIGRLLIDLPTLFAEALGPT